MRLLLDSHVLIWSMRDPKRISRMATEAVEDVANEKLVSAASVWESQMKRRSGRLELATDLAEMARESGFTELPIDWRHGLAAANLPPIHGDPFDRMLVAQAQVDDLTLVTADRRLARYNVPVLSAA